MTPPVTAPTVALADDVLMPRLGLGTWPMTGACAETAVRQALTHGYRSIDTAAAYGNEDAVGRGIAASGVDRRSVFVTTKLANTEHGFAPTLRAFDRSLDSLGLEYLDLYLIHWPMPWLDRYVDSWNALIRLRDESRVRAIGVSNFTPVHIERLIAETGVTPALNQIELNPRTNRLDARTYHQRKGIVTESWGPLGPRTDLLDEPTLIELAAKYGKTPGQIVLRWHMDLGLVTTPKSANSQRISANLNIFDFNLTASEVGRISALDTGAHPPVNSDAPLSGPPPTD